VAGAGGGFGGVDGLETGGVTFVDVAGAGGGFGGVDGLETGGAGGGL
jgi:hypothetical protein